MMRTLLTWGSLLLGLSCLVLAWWQYSRTPSAGTVSIEQPEQLDRNLPVGTHHISFVVRNPQRVPVRVIGASQYCETCNENCRLQVSRAMPFDLQPGTEQVIECDLVLFQPGRYSGQVQVYMATDVAHEILLSIAGEATPAEK
jgi:hypothetical protein